MLALEPALLHRRRRDTACVFRAPAALVAPDRPRRINELHARRVPFRAAATEIVAEAAEAEHASGTPVQPVAALCDESQHPVTVELETLRRHVLAVAHAVRCKIAAHNSARGHVHEHREVLHVRLVSAG
eukprot:Amastigsp_a6997_24.p4 type:complete len:129 gc:universal Amastigsp_a6997_24:1105-1491(+)